MKKRYLIGFMVVALVGAFLWNKIADISSPTDHDLKVFIPPPMKIEVSPVVLIEAMEEKFETTTFSRNLVLPEVTAGRCDGDLWEDFWWRDCLKMQVPAKINVGFGREILNPTRITSTKESVIINLGAPKILDVVIDHKRVLVLNPDDDGGWLTEPYKNLQAEAFVKAEAAFRIKACQVGVYQSAGVSAQKRYGKLARNILKAAGDKRTVKIVYTIPSC